ncbi:MAG TPA: transposase [Clostridiaceae bacterium]|nr:transposase [Clostridiaceae bacterium]
MPRTARYKRPDAKYHIMSRSISELDLFRDDEDKERYMSIVRRYKKKYSIRIYAYCLMDNHSHLMIDANGADISKVMHGINLSYARYYNKKYNRHGHLFQDRFKSRIIGDNGYAARLSAYIHNNPHSMKEYKNCIERYEYSSLGIYMGIRRDRMKIVDKGYLLNLFSSGEGSAVELYVEFMRKYSDDGISREAEFMDEGTVYVNVKRILYRNCTVEKVEKFLKEKINATKAVLLTRNSRKTVEQRAIFALFLRCFCNFSNRAICETMGSISQSRVSMLCALGIELVGERAEYKDIMDEFRDLCVT